MSECASEEAISSLERGICFAERLGVLTGQLSFNRVRSALVPGRQILLALAQKYSKTLAKIITINPRPHPRPVFWRANAHKVLFNIISKQGFSLWSSNVSLRQHTSSDHATWLYLQYFNSLIFLSQLHSSNLLKPLC